MASSHARDSQDRDGKRKRTHPPAPKAPEYDEDGVRAPIQRKMERLVDDRMHMPMAMAMASASGFRLNAPINAFDPFQSFQDIATGTSRGVADKRERLSDLFQTPPDLLCPHTLEAAMELGTVTRKWILVNIQKVDAWDCQTLVRDVWRNDMVRSIVKNGFLLWQRQHNSADGKRYIQEYKIDGFPHVAIVDPRTGARVHVFPRMQSAESFQDQVFLFLDSHSFGSNEATNTINPNPTSMTSSIPVVDVDEASAYAAAIKASLEAADDLEDASSKETPKGNGKAPECVELSDLSEDEFHSGTDDDESVTNVDADDDDVTITAPTTTTTTTTTANPNANTSSDKNPSTTRRTNTINGKGKDNTNTATNTAIVLREEPEKDCAEPIVVIRFKLPDNSRLQRRFYADEKIAGLFEFLGSHSYPKAQFDLVTTHPSRQFSTLDQHLSVTDIGLESRDTIHVQPVNAP